MASTFGAPIQSDSPADVSSSQAPAVSDAPQDALDPNDPRLTSENLDANTEGDAYALPPPPPDAKYRAKFKLVSVEDQATKAKSDFTPRAHDKNGPYYATGIVATILDPTGKYDNIPVYDRWVGTFRNRDGSTKVITVLSKLRQANGQPWFTPGQKLSQKAWMELLVKALVGEPEAGVETQWEWSCQKCGEEAEKRGEKRPNSIRGMHKFPPSATIRGAFDPEMKCPVNPAHGFSRARPTIARVLSLAELGIK